jgi:hypothetical protein
MESDNNKTEPIQELLASKKKEKPGQEFFKTFSDQVLSRLEEPTPKPTNWERLNEKIDPIRAAAAVFAIVIGSALIFALDEGSIIAETESNPLHQVDSRMMTDITTPNLAPSPPIPLSKSKNNVLAEFGMPKKIKSKPEPPRILMNPGANLKPISAKGINLRNNSSSNRVNSLN